MGALDPDRPGTADLFSFDDEPVPELEPEPEPMFIRTRSRPEEAPPALVPHGRDVGTAITTGVITAAALLIALKVFDNAGGVVFVTVALGISAIEMFAALRQRGFRPATLLGIVGTVSLCWAAYARGEQAFPLIVALFTVFTLLWYLLGVETSQPTINIGASLLGFVYVGVLGAHAALLLKFPDGVGMLLGAIIATVAYDIGGYFVGSQIGRTPLAATISPNKTIEGLLGGMSASVFASVLILGLIGVHPWDGGSSFALGLVVAAMAPLGDLCESMLKRDLGIKDMGAILPGHGGILDRIDAMLFVVPATYYLVKLLDLV
jgi:phosphatidate cytidylyltransferase